jgi:hypothetical protein
MSPKLVTVEVAVGTDRDERTGVEARRRVGAGGGGDVDVGRGGGADGGELPSGEASLSALPDTRGGRAAPRQRRPAVEPGDGGDGPHTGVSAGAGEIRWGRGHPVRPDVGGRASVERGRRQGRSRNAATLDARERPVEPRTEAQPASSAARAEGALRRTGANGWEFPSVVRRPRPPTAVC